MPLFRHRNPTTANPPTTQPSGGTQTHQLGSFRVGQPPQCCGQPMTQRGDTLVCQEQNHR